MYLINDSGFKTVINMPHHIDNWATVNRGPICKNCNRPKLDHGYYSKAWRCMPLYNSVFTEKTENTVHSPLTIKRRTKKKMGRAKIVKMPKTEKKKTTSKPKSVAKASKKTGSRFIGKSSGLSVSDFQNNTISGNKKDHLTDKVIARMWRDEFPKAKSYTEKDVASVRSVFNKGKHDNDAPAKPILEYDRDGNPIKKEKASSGPPKRTSKKPTKKTVSKSAARKKKIKEEDEEEEEEENSNSMDEDEEE
jgi:hypothetical protein